MLNEVFSENRSCPPVLTSGSETILKRDFFEDGALRTTLFERFEILRRANSENAKT
jgi:hypothetical protein